MGSFTNYRAIAKFADNILFSGERPVSHTESFNKDIDRAVISIDGIQLKSEKTLDGDKEKKIATEKALFDALFKKYNFSASQKAYYESFIKLFLHQLFTGLPVSLCYQQFIESGVYSTDSEFSLKNFFTVDLSLASENTLNLNVFFSIKKTFPDDEDNLSESSTENIVFGRTTFRIEVNPYKGKKEWTAKFGVVDSGISCKDEYNHILDTRNILKKFIDFLTSILEFAKSFNNLYVPNSKIKSTPLFFVSKDGESMDRVIPSKELHKTLIK